MNKVKCYSAGPGLFPRDLSDGKRETWDEAQVRVRKQNEIISDNPLFEVITPSSDIKAYGSGVSWEKRRACMLLQDLLYSKRSDVVFADVTPFGGREPDSGTIVEAVNCALGGGILVLWANPLTTFAEKYADADVHPDSEFDVHYNLMLEQLYQLSWRLHFGIALPVFDSLEAAVAETAKQIEEHGVQTISIADELDRVDDKTDVVEAVKELMTHFRMSL